jgi:Fur family peroxide stress response transcriptional regulator
MSEQYKIDYLLDQLEVSGKRSTPQRHAVCQALVEHGGHPTVADVFERVREVFPMISQATVYNTIDTLEELGLVRPLDIANREHTHYDLDASPHINIVCTRCGRITDLDVDALDTLLVQVSELSRYDIARNAPLIMYGTCPDCRANDTGARGCYEERIAHSQGDNARAVISVSSNESRPRRHRRRRQRT